MPRAIQSKKSSKEGSSSLGIMSSSKKKSKKEGKAKKVKESKESKESKKAKKRQREEEPSSEEEEGTDHEEEEEEALLEGQSDDESTASADENEEVEDEDEAAAAADNSERGRKKRARRLAQNKRARELRRAAIKAGYSDRSAGSDVLRFLLTTSIVKNLVQCKPARVSATSTFKSYGASEFVRRADVASLPIGSSALRGALPCAEALFRALITECTNLALDAGKRRIDAHVVHKAVSKLFPALRFTAAVPPAGLLQTAEHLGVVEASKNSALQHREKSDVEKIQQFMAKRTAELEEQELVKTAKKAKKMANVE